MTKAIMNRRAFLAASSAGAIAVAVGGNLVIAANGAWAMSTKALTGDEAAMLVRMARATYPHDMLDDAIYGKVVHSLDEKASADATLLKQYWNRSVNINPGVPAFQPGAASAVPEPASLGVVGIGLAAVCLRRRRSL